MISKQQFVRDQGFPDGDVRLYEALMFQPRAAGAIVAAGVLTQQAWIFLALGVVLWWSALVPARNPFDMMYNAVLAKRVGLALAYTPAPRRFSMGLGGTVTLVTGAALAAGLTYIAWALEAFVAAGVAPVLIARFCPGAHLYRRLTAVPGVRAAHSHR